MLYDGLWQLRQRRILQQRFSPPVDLFGRSGCLFCDFSAANSWKPTIYGDTPRLQPWGRLVGGGECPHVPSQEQPWNAVGVWQTFLLNPHKLTHSQSWAAGFWQVKLDISRQVCSRQTDGNPFFVGVWQCIHLHRYWFLNQFWKKSITMWAKLTFSLHKNNEQFAPERAI